MALLRLVWLALLSIFRRPVVMAALVMVPATLVLVAADGLQRFGDVVGMTPAAASGAHHGTHFLVLTALWSSGISSAVVAAVVLTESAATDRHVGRVGGGGRWLTARCLAFVAVIVVAATVSSAMAALRGESLGLDVWLCAVVVSLLYVAVAVIGARLSCDPVVVVGLISGIWILDALASPTMGEGGGWRVFASPFYAAEQAAMGMGSLLSAVGVTALWGAGLILVAGVLYRLRPAPLATAGQGGFAPSMKPERVGSLTRHRPAVVLLALDLWRYRGLGLFVALGPLALMLSSLWLFGGVEVLVPVVTDGRPGLLVTTMPELHATYMGLIAVVSFGGTAGYMIGSSTDGPDRRLAQVSGRLGSVRAVRIGSLVMVGLAVSVSALVPVLIVRSPRGGLVYHCARGSSLHLHDAGLRGWSCPGPSHWLDGDDVGAVRGCGNCAGLHARSRSAGLGCLPAGTPVRRARRGRRVRGGCVAGENWPLGSGHRGWCVRFGVGTSPLRYREPVGFSRLGAVAQSVRAEDS